MHIFWSYIWILRTIDGVISEPQPVLLTESGLALQLDSLNDGSRGAQVVKVHDQHPSDTQLPDKGFPAGVQQFFSWVDLSGTYSNI